MLRHPLGYLPLILASLSAQEPQDDLKDLQAALERPIAVASKRVQRLKEAPADATVITALELESLGYRTLGEALEGVLGFRTNRDHAYEGLAVRGLYLLGDQNTRVLILLDGHALNSPAEVGSSKVGMDFGIPLERIERIEVVRGPASSLYGNNAFLGMVNIVTRVINTETGKGVSAAVQGGSRGESGLWADGGAQWGKVQWNLMAQGFQRRGEALELPQLDPARFPAGLDREESQSAYLRMQAPNWSFRGLALSRTQGLATAPFGATLASPENQYRNRLLSGDLRIEPRWGDTEFLIRLFGDRNEFASRLAYDGIRTPGTVGLLSESDPDRSEGVELQARFPSGNRLFWTVGMEQQWHHYDGKVVQDSGSYVATSTAYGLGNSYLQGEWTALDSLTLVMGIQSARWQVRHVDQDLGGGSAPLPQNTLSGTTPRIAVVWRPTSLDILKALFGQGYRNPTIFERYYADGVLVLSNPDLKPERIWTAEGMWIRIWGNGIQTQVAGTRSRWSNQVFTADAGSSQIQARNALDPIDGTALEAEIQGTWPGWEVKGHAGLYRWERAGQRIDNAAPFEAGLQMTHHLGPWSLSAEARHVGPREIPGTHAPAATTGRLALRWQASNLWVRMSAEDIGNARRRDLIGQEYAPLRILPGDGRAFRFELGMRLQ